MKKNGDGQQASIRHQAVFIYWEVITKLRVCWLTCPDGRKLRLIIEVYALTIRFLMVLNLKFRTINFKFTKLRERLHGHKLRAYHRSLKLRRKLRLNYDRVNRAYGVFLQWVYFALRGLTMMDPKQLHYKNRLGL